MAQWRVLDKGRSNKAPHNQNSHSLDAITRPAGDGRMKNRFIMWIKKKLRIRPPSRNLTHEELEGLTRLFLEGYFASVQQEEQALKECERR